MKYFGTDGIRGKVGEKITFELAFKLGKSLSKLNSDTVVIGTDTRESKDDLTNAVILGAMSSGLKVINGGVVPTPALIYYSQTKKITGVMITASHNPYYDNGLKVLNKGVKLTQQEEKMIEEEMDKTTEVKLGVVDLEHTDEVEELYIDFFKRFNHETKFKVIIDCAHGAVYRTAPTIINNYTNDLIVCSNIPNGTNINNNVGSTHVDKFVELVRDSHAVVGFSFDGDGDRVLAVEFNQIIDGDQIIYIIAKHLKKIGKLNKDTVVLTKMSNLGILKALEKLDIKYTLTDVGDKNVVSELMKNNYSVGGENSGHIIMPNILPTGDGVLVAVVLLDIMAFYDKTLLELLEEVDMYADKMINLEVEDKTIINSSKVKKKIKQIEKSLKKEGKVIVRASGTENLIRVSVMAKTMDLVDSNINELVQLIKE